MTRCCLADNTSSDEAENSSKDAAAETAQRENRSKDEADKSSKRQRKQLNVHALKLKVPSKTRG